MTEINGLDERISELKTLYQEAERINLKKTIELLVDINHLEELRELRNKQKPRKGHWIIDGHHRRCHKCNKYFCIKDAEGDEIPSKFCPNCGADMREEQE